MVTAPSEILARLQHHLQHVDESALVILKGHLVVEEALSEIIGTFVFHSEQLDGARITFAQKVAIARSMSHHEHNNEMWKLVLGLNSLRNVLAHALDSPERVKKTNVLISLYKHLGGSMTMVDGKEVPEHVLLSFVVAYSLGFLAGFIDEVRRFRIMIDEMGRGANPQSYE